MDLLFMSITVACLVLSLHSKLQYLFGAFCETFYTNTTSSWRVETMFPVIIRMAASTFMTFILMRMLGLVARVMRGVVYGAKRNPSHIVIYPRVRFYKGVLPSPRCAICLCEGSNNAVLECGHAFHWACVCPWLDRRSTCPLCMRVQSRRVLDAMGRVVVDTLAGEN